MGCVEACGILLLLIVTEISGKNVNCTQETVCTCELKSAGLLNLAGSGGDMSYVEVTSGAYKFRYYPCGITESWGGFCKVSNSPAVCQYEEGTNSYFVLGKSSEYQLTRAVANGKDTYFDFVFNKGTFDAQYGDRKAYVTVKCEDIGTSEFVFIEENPTLNYSFILKTKNACLTARGLAGHPGMALFIALLVLVPIVIILYLSAGMGVQVVRGKRRWELIPNLAFWKSAPILFLDGFLFLFSCFPVVRKRLRNVEEKGHYEEVPH